MNGILAYAAPARPGPGRLLGVLSGCIAGIVVTVPTLVIQLEYLLQWQFNKPGMHHRHAQLAAAMMVAPVVAIVTLSATGLILATAGIERDNRAQWLAPLGFMVNSAALIAGLVSALD